MSVTQVYLTRCPVGNATEIALQKGWLFEDLRQAGGELALLRDLPPANWGSHFTHDHPSIRVCFIPTSPLWSKRNIICSKRDLSEKTFRCPAGWIRDFWTKLVKKSGN